MIGIYKIQSFIKQNRSYIGSSVDINNRWRCHINDLKNNRHKNSRLQNHFNKYGLSDFNFSILLECDTNDLIKLEQSFIDSNKPFFNICKVAGNTLGYKHTEEVKLKMRKPKSEEAKLKMKKPKSEEAKKKMSLSKIGKAPWNKNKKMNKPAWNKGIKLHKKK